MTGNEQGVTGRESTEQGDERRGVPASDRLQGVGPMGPDPGRRAFLAAVAGLAITGTAGCTGDDGGSQDPTSTGENEDTGDGMGGTGTGDGMGGTGTGDGMGGTGTGDGMGGTGTGDGMGGTDTGDGMGTGTGDGMGGTEAPPDDLAAWRTMELTDVRSDETFTIHGLDGPVVIQSFAVWCPKCEQQSKNIAELDDSVARVSLNIDPNEDASKVADHAADNGFDWRFAVAPTDLTKELKDQFGVSVTVAPSTPIIVACEGGGATFKSGSILSASEIESIVNDC